MEYTKELLQLLKKCGYRPLSQDHLEIWGKLDESSCHFVYVIPERLPGQPDLDLEQILKVQEKEGNQMMLRSGKTVSWLTLMVFKGYPDAKNKQEMEKYNNIWCLNRTEGKLMVYENQGDDYEELRLPLEEFAESYLIKKNQEERASVFRMFTPVNTGIVVLNVLIFLLLSLFGDMTDPAFMAKHGAMYREAIMNQHEYYRMFTGMFLHFGVQHLTQNMLILLLIGPRLERIVGKIPYLVIYLGAGMLASMASVIFTLQADGSVISAGASGAIFGVMGGLLAIIIKDSLTRRKGRIRNIGLNGILFMIFSALSYGFMETGIDNAAHLGGLLGGFILTVLLSLLSVV